MPKFVSVFPTEIISALSYSSRQLWQAEKIYKKWRIFIVDSLIFISARGPNVAMLYKFVRESFFGRLIYHLSSRKLFNYPEEQAHYVIPEKYLHKGESEYSTCSSISNIEPYSSETSSLSSKTLADNGLIIVTWDGEDDAENPYNWPLKYKVLFAAQISILTAFVCMGSAIYTPGVEEIMEKMQISQTLATSPLTMFVFGYGIGPMLFAPMSENARFGRTTIYIVTLFIFFLLQIPTALVEDIASLSVLRFLAGFFASPCLMEQVLVTLLLCRTCPSLLASGR